MSYIIIIQYVGPMAVNYNPYKSLLIILNLPPSNPLPCQLSSIIKRLVTEQYQAVERVFHELDEKNTKRLTQETMYQLLKRY